MRLLTTKQFEKDLKRHRKRGKNLDKLWNVLERLLSQQPLDPRHDADRNPSNRTCSMILIIRREKHLRTADVRTLRVQGEAADPTMLAAPRENSRIPLTCKQEFSP